MKTRSNGRRPGAQPGNLNRLKHGFYSKQLRGLDLKAAGDMANELGEEVALYRALLQRYLHLALEADNDRRMREVLDEAGFPKVRIVASSGFGVGKCRVMAEAKAPIDVVGTGSFIPDQWHETYATADIVDYDGQKRVKVGREFLLRAAPRRRNGGG